LFTVSLGLVIPIFGGRPVLTMIISQVLAALATPIIVLLMLLMQRREDIMDDYRSSPLMNLLIGIIFLFTVLMAITGIIGIKGLL
jgi:Mn2+/Fe2+ NRAMP family transporter